MPETCLIVNNTYRKIYEVEYLAFPSSLKPNLLSQKLTKHKISDIHFSHFILQCTYP